MDPQAATADLASIRDDLSRIRFHRYEQATGGGLEDAMDLYLWNTDVSAAFYAVLQGVEIILRNALSKQMELLHRRRGYQGMWFDDPFGLLDTRHQDDIANAKLRLQRDHYPITQDRMITVLSFGFWRFLLAGRHEHTLWIPALRRAFPHAPTGRRGYIATRVEHLHHLRNRIAHHEPVYPRMLQRDMEDALDVVRAINPRSAAWLEMSSWAPRLLTKHIPAPRGRTP